MRRRTHRPEPQAIDPASGFKVPLSELVTQWDGEKVSRRFVDRRNPQDFVRGVRDNQALPFARPETPDVFMAENLLFEDGSLIFQESGPALLTEGPVAEL